MSDLDTIAKLLLEIETLKVHLTQMKRHHLQVMLVLTHAFGGELRIEPSDYTNVPPGTQLVVAKDPLTGGTIFRVQVPEPMEEIAHVDP